LLLHCFKSNTEIGSWAAQLACASIQLDFFMLHEQNQTIPSRMTDQLFFNLE
jgi:hypothetical protein